VQCSGQKDENATAAAIKLIILLSATAGEVEVQKTRPLFARLPGFS